MTYLYYTTVKGLPLVKDKAILISTAHDEPPIYLKTFDTLFSDAEGTFLSDRGGKEVCGTQIPQ